jgi:hypothetical protein
MRDESKLQLAFRKPVSLIDRLMAQRVGKYIHVELIFPEPYVYGRTSFSSRGKKSSKQNRRKGVSFVRIEYSHPERWDFYTLPHYQSDIKITLIRDRCLQIAKTNAKYDAIGAVLWAGFDVPVEEKTKWWCSEVIAWVLYCIPYRITPLELYNDIFKES